MKIAIVDDDEIFRHIMTQQLKKINQNDLLFFEDGQKAADYFKSHSQNEAYLPDLLFLDLNMPIMDGWSFLNFYDQFSVSKKTVIYILTSSNHSVDIERAKQNRLVHSYLTKPLALESLMRACNPDQADFNDSDEKQNEILRNL